ncbi:MAG: hypothetical protein QOI10_2346 [Solirubrobacterales bacterium]|jgi:hypothetical protein|nr:hypothetical protein [Solirubrobacterales bacterium]
MSDALDLYLNDHLAGATLGSDLAKQIRDRAEGTPLGETMAEIAAEIERDRETLLELMEATGTSRNPVKQVTGWVAEKASRVKFSGAASGEPEQSLFMAVETLRLGVAGKKCLWLALQQVRSEHQELAAIDLEGLIARAAAQEGTLERERLAAGARALGAAD